MGLGSGLKVSSFEYVPERFSIPDYSRKLSKNDGTVYITPQPQGSCEVRFRSVPTEPVFSLTGRMYAVPFAPNAPIRVSAPPVELLFSPNRVSMDMSMKFGERMPLDHWHTYSQLKIWSMKGPLQVELWRDHRRLDASTLIDRQTGHNLDWEALHSLSTAIRTIAVDRKVTDHSFSLPDINAHIGDLGYVAWFAAHHGIAIKGADRPMPNVTANGITLVNFGMGSPNAATVMDLLSAISPKAVLFLGKCGGLKRKNQTGDLILPITATRRAGRRRRVGTPSGPDPRYGITAAGRGGARRGRGSSIRRKSPRSGIGLGEHRAQNW